MYICTYVHCTHVHMYIYTYMHMYIYLYTYVCRRHGSRGYREFVLLLSRLCVVRVIVLLLLQITCFAVIVLLSYCCFCFVVIRLLCCCYVCVSFVCSLIVCRSYRQVGGIRLETSLIWFGSNKTSGPHRETPPRAIIFNKQNSLNTHKTELIHCT